MCGIAGFIGKGDDGALQRMNSALAHRGPDDQGSWMEGGVGLAHRRLSIVDLSSAGHQPMHSANAVIVFNGEIYNFRELKKDLRDRGVAFKSESDTEVILELFEKYREETFEKLQGMFALALYDKRTETLFLVRDRMGEKPLYYATQDGGLVFASEPKALFAHGAVSKSLNPEAIGTYLTYDAVLTPQSIYSGISKVPAATYIAYKDGRVTAYTYWHPPTTINTKITFDEAKEILDQLFEKSVSSQMVADVPVGIFLSGGLDSSLVAYYAKRDRHEPVHTFSLGFEDRSYDESSYAKEVAAMLGTEHHERITTAAEIRDALSAIIPKLDEPIADPAILPNYLLSCFARERVTVALGGDGGDELFAGYQTFTAEKFLRSYQLLPQSVRKSIVEPLVAALPVSHRYFSLDFKAKQFLRGANTAPQYVHQAWLSSFSREEEKKILTPEYREKLSPNPYERIDEYLAELGETDAHLAATYFYLRTYMQDDILAKVDRASMYTSLEVRAPFLDKKVVEFGLSLPHKYKYRGTQGKYILRQLMKGRLPERVVRRGKHGFGVPVGAWFREEWRDFLRDTLSSEHLAKTGVFDSKEVERLVQEHQDGTHNHRKKLWSLLIFQLWYDTWIS